MGPEDFEITCWSYTHARRHPQVLGKVGGAHLPFGPYTPTQGVVAIGTGAFMYLTRGLWGQLVSTQLRVVLLFGVPALAMFIFRNLRVEGRSPLFFLLGALSLIWQPRHGFLRGARARPPRVLSLFRRPINSSRP